MSDYDSPWKEALDVFFEAFMELFLPQAHADIDWSRDCESLDKELQKITPDAEVGRRYVDKLVKVWLKSGEEQWVLVHIEVQASEDPRFAWRMISTIAACSTSIIDLPEPFESAFEYQLTQFKEEKHMPFITTPERMGRKEGLKEGLSQGRADGIEVALKLKFGALALSLMPEIRQISNEEKLETILHAIESAASPEDLRRIWAG